MNNNSMNSVSSNASSKNKKILLATICMFVAIGAIIFVSLKDTAMYYSNVLDVFNQGETNKMYRISGVIDRNSVDIKANSVSFKLQDRNSTATAVNIVYVGVLPDAFDNGTEAVVEGRYSAESKTLNATSVLVKCPSKYEPSDVANKTPTAMS